jgi:hypothetical protein
LPTFADGGCHVVSMTDPCDCILGLLDELVVMHCPINPITNPNPVYNHHCRDFDDIRVFKNYLYNDRRYHKNDLKFKKCDLKM